MKKAELMNLVGKRVRVTFTDGDVIEGRLAFADEFSAKHDYFTPGNFYLKEILNRNNIGFKVSHTKRVEVLE